MLKRSREAGTAAAEERRVLYGYWRSTSSWRVRIALELKALPFEYRAVNLLANEDSSPAFLALNPAGTLPFFVDDPEPATTASSGVRIAESMAILEYLDERYPASVPLLPSLAKDGPGAAALRATIRAIALRIVAGTHPLQNNVVLAKVQALGGGDAKTAWARDVIASGLEDVEALVKPLAGRYSVGDRVTLLDVVLVPQFYNAARFGVDTAPYPTLARVVAELGKLDAFRAAHPDAMPDAPAPQ